MIQLISSIVGSILGVASIFLCVYLFFYFYGKGRFYPILVVVLFTAVNIMTLVTNVNYLVSHIWGD